MGKKRHFGPDLDPLDPISAHDFLCSKIWFRQSADVMVSDHHVQYQKKLMIRS